MLELEADIKYLKGVGPKRAELIERELGVHTLSDLVHFYPFRYEDRSYVYPISEVRPGASVQVRATVVRTALYGPAGSIVPTDGPKIQYTAAKRLSVIVADASGQMEMVFFKGIKWNHERLKPGQTFLFYGRPSDYNGRLNIVHPEVDVPAEGSMAQGVLTGIYPSTEKLKNAGLTGKVMCRLQAAALSLCLPEVKETLPQYVLEENALCSLPFALRNIHFPADARALEAAQRRLKFEELFLLQISLLKQKYIRSRSDTGLVFQRVGNAFNTCFGALPYELTGAQKRVIKEIRADLLSGRQMNRLLQGDVGSGKTMVAVLTALLAIDNGYQACIMAPTEVLARQHYENISRYLAPTGVKCALLTGSSTKKERASIHAGLTDGSLGLIVGTHALLEPDVVFARLGLAVIDEQHRFGVEQRSKLWSKGPGIAPHVLVMTATPIPRTLAMTVYGDLDVSVIDEMPPGRKPVRTTLHLPSKLPVIYNFMRREIAAGHQVFVVYPMIFESEKMDLQNLEAGYEEILKQFPLPDYRVAMVHGKQPNEEKNFNMAAFSAGRANILVSTTVIEVGVDVPNASVMVVMSAERFGLSQLHQLRGRVGRGAAESHCVLVRDVKTTREGVERLELMCRTEDGFEIAEEDMRMRGMGDLSGTQQSGLPIDLKLASLAKDGRLLEECRAYAAKVLESDPSLSDPRNEALARELKGDKYAFKDFSKIS